VWKKSESIESTIGISKNTKGACPCCTVVRAQNAKSELFWDNSSAETEDCVSHKIKIICFIIILHGQINFCLFLQKKLDY